MGCTKHSLHLDDLQASSESSKVGWYKTTTFRWLTKIIQIWMVQIIQTWMISSNFQLSVCMRSRQISSKNEHYFTTWTDHSHLEDLGESQISYPFWISALPGYCASNQFHAFHCYHYQQVMSISDAMWLETWAVASLATNFVHHSACKCTL